MPVASLVAVGTAAATGLAKKAIGGAIAGGGKKKAAAAQASQNALNESGKWGERFSGIMAGTSRSMETSAVDKVSQNNSGPLGSITRETIGSLNEKFPENPAYSLALKADEIFRPEIVGVNN